MDGPQEHAVEFPLHNVDLTEIIKIQADDIKQSHRDQRKTINEKHLFEFPTFELRYSTEENEYEPITGHSSKNVRKRGDEKISLIRHAGFGVLPQVLPKYG